MAVAVAVAVAVAMVVAMVVAVTAPASTSSLTTASNLREKTFETHLGPRLISSTKAPLSPDTYRTSVSSTYLTLCCDGSRLATSKAFEIIRTLEKWIGASCCSCSPESAARSEMAPKQSCLIVIFRMSTEPMTEPDIDVPP